MPFDDSAVNRRERLAAEFRDKPERVIDLPGWMLPGEQVAQYRAMDDLAIVEIAGRDSVAAAVRAVSENGYGNLLPVYAYTGSEYGFWGSVGQAASRLAARLPNVRVHPLLIVGSPDFWHAVNGRFISDLVHVFGHYTPCTGCHLYLHAIRVPLARLLGNVPIIAGERKSHSGTVKINQVGQALDFYQRFIQRFGIRLDLPLAEIEDDRAIEDLLEMPWAQGKEQLGCCLSGNYKGAGGNIAMDTVSVMRFFDEFAGPATDAIIRDYLEGRVPDHPGIAKQTITRCLSESKPS